MLRLKLHHWSNLLFRTAIAALFGYFGVLAVKDPVLQTQLWVNPDIYNLIIPYIQVEFFIRIFGFVQIAVAILMVAGKYLKIVFGLAALMLIGIIVNLGMNEVSYRDAVILTGVIYLWIQEF